ncbi:MAG: type II secretion system protein [Phycisphaerales bacterium]
MAMRLTPSPLVRARGAFTLVELLVVIAIIALLVAILLPAIAGARRAGQASKCLSNVKQMITASHTYASDYKDHIWGARGWGKYGRPVVNDGSPNTLVIYERGLLFQYCGDVDAIAECPTNKRQRATGAAAPITPDPLFNHENPINWDYTMVYRMEGARVDLTLQVGYLTDPSSFGPNTPNMIDGAQLSFFSGMPLFIEESTAFNNQLLDTEDADPSNASFGLFGGSRGNITGDQPTERHDGAATIGFLQGHAESIKLPHGPDPLVAEPLDLTADGFYVQSKTGYLKLERRKNTWGAMGPFSFGWINNPF